MNILLTVFIIFIEIILVISIIILIQNVKENKESLDINLLRTQQLYSIHLLDKTVAILNKHGIQYSLFYGTALGATRTGKFIPWDEDIDIIIFKKISKKILQKIFSKSGTMNIFNTSPNCYKVSYTHMENENGLDIFYPKKIDQHGMSICYPYHSDNCLYFPIDKIFPLKTIKFEKGKYKIFNDVEYFLKKRYGKKWKIPNENVHNSHFTNKQLKKNHSKKKQILEATP